MTAIMLLAAAAPLQVFDDPQRLRGLVSLQVRVDTADVDGDGLLDTLLEDQQAPRLRWIRSRPGAGPGAFATLDPGRIQPLFEVDAEQIRTAPIDIDRDGDADFVVAAGPFGANTWTVDVRINAGGGDFGAPIVLASIEGRPSSLSTADIDGDGFDELLISRLSDVPSTLEACTYFDNVGGTLTGPVLPLFAAPGIYALDGIDVADFDLDGRDDLLLGSAASFPSAFSGSALILSGQGGPPFDLASSVRIAEKAFFAQVADLNADGLVDVAFRDGFAASPLIVQLNQGSLSFTSAPSIFPANARVSSIAFGDRDGDGDDDALVSFSGQPGSGGVDLYDNVGGVFSLVQSGVSTSAQPYLADVTGDGRADLLQEVPLRFTPATAGPAPYGPPQRLGESFAGGEVQLVNADGDDQLDLLVVATGAGAGDAGTLSVKRGLGGGRFGAPVPFSGPGSPERQAYAGDFDGDGAIDVISPDASGAQLLLFGGRGDGTFEPAVPVGAIDGVPGSAEVHDLDGDGLDDLIYTSSNGRSVLFAFGDPGGALVAASGLQALFSQAVTPVAVDVDGDGDRDVAVLVGGRLELALNATGRTFAPRAVIATGISAAVSERPFDLDVDQDGQVDLLLPGRVVYRGLGGGTFASALPVQGATAFGKRIQARDVDLDGDLDLVFLRELGAPFRITWSENLGGLAFGPLLEIRLELPGNDQAFTSGDVRDIDGDGDLDVLGTHPASALVRFEGAYFLAGAALGEVGAPYCGAPVPNSTGEAGALGLVGSTDLGLGRLELRAASLPASTFGFFLTSQTQANVLGVPGSAGRLCLGGAIGRFVGPGQVQSTGVGSSFRLAVDLSGLPEPQLGSVPAQAGQTWSFQAWHRDSAAGGGSTSNFTEALAVTF